MISEYPVRSKAAARTLRKRRYARGFGSKFGINHAEEVVTPQESEVSAETPWGDKKVSGSDIEDESPSLLRYVHSCDKYAYAKFRRVSP